MARDELLPRYEELVAAFLGRPGVALGRSLHRDTLTVDGRLFASVLNDGLLIKVSEERVGELVERGDAALFRGSGGRVMREWAIALPASDWAALAEESMEFVRAAGSTPRRRTSR
jgi:hypothetical protein